MTSIMRFLDYFLVLCIFYTLFNIGKQLVLRGYYFWFCIFTAVVLSVGAFVVSVWQEVVRNERDEGA